MRHVSRGLAPLVALLFVSIASAQSRFATSVVQFQQGGGSGAFDPALALGGPRGGGMGSGSVDVLTLGTGGELTLAFDVILTDGPGADFSVFENGFVFSGGVFAEVCFVEVSSDGSSFARFPTRYSGPQGPLPTFGTLPFATFSGLAGANPVLANVDTNTSDPFDPVVSGGEAFDLADLAGHPEVTAGRVNLGDIRFVRLVDVVAGSAVDQRGITIWDVGGDSGADIDAVAVIQHTGNQVPDGPGVDAFVDAQGFAHLVLGDPDGLGDLDPVERRMSVDLVPMRFERLRRFFDVASVSSTEIHLVTPVPLAHSGRRMVLSVSLRDRAGNFASDTLVFHR